MKKLFEYLGSLNFAVICGFAITGLLIAGSLTMLAFPEAYKGLQGEDIKFFLFNAGPVHYWFYLLVVAWFKSFTTPLVIMAPIPLTLIGIMPGLGPAATIEIIIALVPLQDVVAPLAVLLRREGQQHVAGEGEHDREVVVARAGIGALLVARADGLQRMVVEDPRGHVERMDILLRDHVTG